MDDQRRAPSNRLARAAVAAALSLPLTHASAGAAPMSLEALFRGRLSAKGSVENLKTGSRRAFTMALQASWEGPEGTLVEDVVFADGETQHKVWRFEKQAEGRYVGRREDVSGLAEVTEDREGVHMVYKATTRVNSALTLDLSFDDRLTQIAPDTVTVRSDISYLFVSAARMDMTIKKSAPQ